MPDYPYDPDRHYTGLSWLRLFPIFWLMMFFLPLVHCVASIHGYFLEPNFLLLRKLLALGAVNAPLCTC